jgi:hypothetical protein
MGINEVVGSSTDFPTEAMPKPKPKRAEPIAKCSATDPPATIANNTVNGINVLVDPAGSTGVFPKLQRADPVAKVNKHDKPATIARNMHR